MLSVAPSFIAQTYNHTGIITSQDLSSRQDSNSEPVPPIQPVTDSVSVSNESRTLSRRSSDANRNNEDQSSSNRADQQSSDTSSASDQASIQKFQARDREVRAHEQAHLAAAGQYAQGGASFVYQRGPDGQLYAVGGEVAIDIGRERTPQETIAKMQAVRRAALAPANPSAADRQIAAQASVRLAEAQRDLSAERTGSPQMNPETSSSSAIDAQPATADGGGANRRILMVEAYQAVNELF